MIRLIIERGSLLLSVSRLNMEFDETEVTDFFGVTPLAQDPEECEFFGSCAFEVVRGQLVLRISFSPTHSPKVIADIFHSSGGVRAVHAVVSDAAAVRIHSKPQRLVVLAARPGGQSSDPQLEERLTVSLDPLSVAVSL
jgi:hypothetical protein